MVTENERAPDFTALQTSQSNPDETTQFNLKKALEDGPVVLAFYPAAFTQGCRSEMHAFDDSVEEFNEAGIQIYGISVDLPFSQGEWIRQQGFHIPMLSDPEANICETYGVVREDILGELRTARRSIFVIDTERVVRFKWVQGDDLPEFTAVVENVLSIAKAIEN